MLTNKGNHVTLKTLSNHSHFQFALSCGVQIFSMQAQCSPKKILHF